ncbi:MAG TPA: hypothetical protein VGR89_15075, partial [Puia sp.]|nr:hypothetical protein [Puia sp.]
MRPKSKIDYNLMKPTNLTRAELYTLVWSKPLSTLASSYGLSDSKLRRICIDCSIPLPRAGHWDRVQSGEAVPIPPLPPLDGKERETSLVRPGEKTQVREQSRALDLLLVPVRESLTRKDAYLRDGLRHSDSGQLDIRVSPNHVSRALQFMNHLLQAVRASGHRIEDRHVIVAGQKMEICCREKLKRVSVKDHSWPRTTLVPTGTLAFQLIPEWSWNAKEWREGAETLEEKIPAIIEKMESESRRLAEEDRQHKIREAERAQEERVRKEME